MKRWLTAARFIGLGWYVGVCIAGGVWVGIWLDHKLNTNIFIFLGLALGLVLAFWGMYHMILPIFKGKD